MPAKFTPGEIVQLKSGGPAMTVSSSNADGQLHCTWFRGATRESAYFKPETLQTYTPPATPPAVKK